MKRLTFAAVGAALLVALVPNVSRAAPPASNPDEKAVAITQPSMVYLEQYWSTYVHVNGYGYLNGGQPFKLGFRCSGFIVSPDGYIATAGHCVNTNDFLPEAAAAAVDYLWTTNAGRQELYGLIIRGKVDANWSEAQVIQSATDNWAFGGQASGSGPDLQVFAQRGTVTGGKKDGEALPARVIGSEPASQGDVAILKIEQSNLPAIQVGTNSTLAIGTPLLSVGYPGNVDALADQSLDPSFTDGKITAQKTLEGGLLPAYQISSAISGGMSGGPTVDLNGVVIGVNSQSLAKGTGQAQDAGFNYIEPASMINEMLAKNGVRNSLSDDDKAWRAGLDMYFKGDGKGAVKQFQSIQDQSRPLLADYLRKAQAVAKTQGGFPILIVIIALVVLLVGGGVAGFMISRKRKAPAPTPGTAASAAEPIHDTTQEPVNEAGPASGVPATPAQPAAPMISSTDWKAPQAPAQESAAETPPAVSPAPGGRGATAPAPEPASVVTAHVPPPNGASSPKRYCSKCGNSVPASGANFCPNCGNTIS